MINTASWCTFAAAAQTSACKWALKKTGDKASHGQQKTRAIQVIASTREVVGEKCGARATLVFDGIRFELIRRLIRLFVRRTCSKYEVQRTAELQIQNSKHMFSPKTPREPFGFYCCFQHLSWLWSDMIQSNHQEPCRANHELAHQSNCIARPKPL